uniref:choline transporter-like protein 5 n=1 Tax=Ciona intestinalis TaxID=7719 RepID=UPI000180CA12|nr:choline transporter-like protein 5 [Ciona intestinalis]XP_018668803.1 choline transporter-like protein 5 [Ciona intestinalis]|eukprot:XP_002126506.1 choline transporter-like protein 5 [Ciona intestinalis]
MGHCCSCSHNDGEGDVSEGEPYGKEKTFDPNFKGPIKKRSCTDILCCLLFFVFIIGYIVIGLFAWLNGDPVILLFPTDNQGRICGLNYGDLDLRGKSNLFYFDITKCASAATLINFQCQTTQICVSSCPDTYWTYLPDVAKLELAINTASAGATREQIATAANTTYFLDWNKYICTYGFNARDAYVNDGMDIQAIMNSGKCAPYYLPFSPVVGRCIPRVATDLVSFAAESLDSAGNSLNATLVDSNNQTITGQSLLDGTAPIKLYLEARAIAEKIFADLTVSWYWLLGMLGITAIVAFLWIVIMRWVAGVMVWVTLLGIIGVLSFGVWYCYDEWNKLKTVAGSKTSIISVGFTTNLSTYLALQDTWLAFLIILAIVDAILILVIIFLRKRIQIAIQIIRQSSKAIGWMISTLFYPLVTFILVLIVISFWAATALFLASSGSPVYQVIDSRNLTNSTTGQACNINEWSNSTHQYYLNDAVSCVFVKYGGTSIFHNNVIWLQVVAVFGMLWIVNWVLALGQCTLAGAFASYYWAWKKPQDIPLLPLYSSFGRALRYHTGSLAFGSLIIAIVQIIRILLEYADNKLKAAENKVAKFVLKCLKCCFWCLEKFLKFLNRNAYIMIAVYGKHFCWSAKEAFKLLMRNIIRVAVLDKVTDFILFIGKLIVTVGMGALAWAFFTDKFISLQIFAPSLNYYWMPIIIISIAAYFVASGFFNTFAMAVDTIFLCFLEDLERNDGTEEKPYYMSKGLMKVLGKKNKKKKKTKDE